jgi:hypothetical protein
VEAGGVATSNSSAMGVVNICLGELTNILDKKKAVHFYTTFFLYEWTSTTT